MSRPRVLPMRAVDLARARAVALDAFGSDQVLAGFETDLAKEHVIGRVVRAHAGEPVAGFAVYWVIADTAEILHIAVDSGARRAGCGLALMRDAMAGARARGCSTMLLEVRRSNTAALGLYRGLGFTQVGVRPRYYSDNGEDALLLSARLSADAEPAP